MKIDRNTEIFYHYLLGKKPAHIARDIGVSRQRVDQIISRPKRQHISKAKRKERTDKSLMAVRPRCKRFTKTVSSGLGRFGEEKFIEEAEKYGYKPKDMREIRNYDFEVKGKRIEVKTAKFNKKGRWCFNFLKNSFDIIIFIGITNNLLYFFIVPKFCLQNKNAITLNPFRDDTKLWNWIKEYQNMWCLLD